MVAKIGIIGMSEGNGHPFSYSSIINGYSDPGLKASGWSVIYDYVRRRDPSEFGINGLQVTHAWTQELDQTKILCEACLIPHALLRQEEFIGNVDAVIIARDDYENHYRMAAPFLEAGLHVFVDKPLSLDVEELKFFKPYLENGKLMSCSGMRYAKELDEPRASLPRYGRLKLIRGAIVLSWEKYGIHLVDAVFGIIKSTPVSIVTLEGSHASLAVNMADGSLLQLDSLGESPATFRVDIWGTEFASSHDIRDNFSMFRRMLWHFARSIETNKPAIPPQHTIDLMRLMIAGRIALSEKRKVSLDEIQI